MFAGALGYADDIVVLAPTAGSMNAMLKICGDYATEYSVKFNSSKTKLLIFPCKTFTHVPKVVLNGQEINLVKVDTHH